MDKLQLEIDIDYNSHSFYIGKGGNQIQKIMDSHKTLIHFPDVNKTSSIKSNQVSIKGLAANIQNVIEELRCLQPITLQMHVGFTNESDFHLIKELALSAHKGKVQLYTFQLLSLKGNIGTVLFKFRAKFFRDIYYMLTELMTKNPQLHFLYELSTTVSSQTSLVTLRSIPNIYCREECCIHFNDENSVKLVTIATGSLVCIALGFLELRKNLTIKTSFQIEAKNLPYLKIALLPIAQQMGFKITYQIALGKANIIIGTIEDYREQLLAICELSMLYFGINRTKERAVTNELSSMV